MQDAKNETVATTVKQKNTNSPQPSFDSPLQAYCTNTAIAYANLSVMGILSPFLPLTNLDQTKIAVVGTSITLGNFVAAIPVARKVSKNGGRIPLLFCIGSTLTGMASLTALSAVTDIRTIDGLDWRFGTMLMSGYLIGFGGGAYSTFLSSIKRVPRKELISVIIAAHGAIVNSSSITTPLIVNALSQRFNYTVPFAMYTALLLANLIFAGLFLRETPYHYFRKTFSHERAKELAMAAGQLESMIQENKESSTLDFLKENIKLAMDRRGFVIYWTGFVMLGSYLVGNIFPTMLKYGYDIDPITAIYIASFANLITILTRLAGGKIIANYDHESGGMHVFLAGCALIIAACISLTFSTLPQWTVYLSVALMNMGFGLTLFPPANIAINWSKPKNENLEPYNPDIIIGAMGAPGTLGGFILPLLLGWLVEEQGKAGYQNYFFIIMTMMLMTAIAIPAVDYSVRHTEKELRGFFDKPMTLFGCSRFINKNKNNTADIEMPEEKKLLPEPLRLG